ncbi:hypothetical protein ACOME3_007990 [Neoechinorhynchus agilis]
MGFAKQKSANSNESKSKQFTIKYPRLIVRNIPFSIKEKRLQKEFKRFGDVSECKIVTKVDGNSAGFGFIRYENMESAKKCLSEMSSYKLGGRMVSVDWALPKDVYEMTNINQEDNEEVEKEVPEDKTEIETINDMEKEDNTAQKEERRNECFEQGSMDVQKKETVFIRNLALETNEKAILDVMSSFGEVKYVKIVKDKITGRSRGCAFVRYVQSESAENAIAASSTENRNPIMIDAREISVVLALPRKEVEKERKIEKEKKTAIALDKRHLLCRKSVMETASKREAKMRETLQKETRENLKNHSRYFQSEKRLSIHNLPKRVTEQELNRIVLDASGNKDAVVTECRIMRERLKDGSLGRSLGYAFVSLENSNDALACVENLDGNENIFDANHRPVVDFAVENRIALALKKARFFRSMQKKDGINDELKNEKKKRRPVKKSKEKK